MCQNKINIFLFFPAFRKTSSSLQALNLILRTGKLQLIKGQDVAEQKTRKKNCEVQVCCYVTKDEEVWDREGKVGCGEKMYFLNADWRQMENCERPHHKGKGHLGVGTDKQHTGKKEGKTMQGPVKSAESPVVPKMKQTSLGKKKLLKYSYMSDGELGGANKLQGRLMADCAKQQ